MSLSFAQSETSLNLMRAFAGESQARNRYTFSASVAKKQKLAVIQQVFLFTAQQECAHAKIFFDHLAPLAGVNLQVDGKYPVENSPQVLAHLKAAHHNEYGEFEREYPTFAKVATEEGFAEIALSFSTIALIEKTHGDRFAHFAKLLETDTLFTSQTPTQWMCLNCGHLHSGLGAPKECAVCQHAQGYFIRLDLAPFTSSTMLAGETLSVSVE